MEQLFLLLGDLLLPVFFLLLLLLVELGLLLPHGAHQLVLEDDHLLLFSVDGLEVVVGSLWWLERSELVVEFVVGVL